MNPLVHTPASPATENGSEDEGHAMTCPDDHTNSPGEPERMREFRIAESSLSVVRLGN